VPRIRRPLLALLVLVVALVIGYGIRAARSDGVPPPPAAMHTSAGAPWAPAAPAAPTGPAGATGRP
jgi:hypothetical protein